MDIFQSGWGKYRRFYVKHCFIYMTDAMVVENMADMLDLIQSIRQDNVGFTRKSMILADKAIC